MLNRPWLIENRLQNLSAKLPDDTAWAESICAALNTVKSFRKIRLSSIPYLFQDEKGKHISLL